jgi:L-ribulose-5-phosphate 4-epimerase
MRPIPIMGTTHADHLACDIPCTEVMDDHAVKGDYEEETGRQIVKRFADLSFREIEMVLVACHGPFTWGGNAMKAVYSSVMCEELARMAMMTLGINPSTPRLKQSLIDKHWQRKHGENAYYGQPEGH